MTKPSLQPDQVQTGEGSKKSRQHQKQPRRINAQLVDWLKAQAVENDATLIVWDDQLRGFGVSAGKTGAVSYLVQWWSGGRQGKSRRVVVGKHLQPVPADIWLDGKVVRPGTIIRADVGRKLAAAMIAKIKSGYDPHDARAAAEVGRRRSAETFGAVIRDYLDTQGEGRRSWDQTRRTLLFEFGIEGAAKSLDIRPLRELTRQDFRSVRDRIKARGHSACRQYFAALNVFLKWCVDEEKLDTNPAEKIGVPKKGDPRDRVLTDDELTALWKATDRLSDYRHRDIVRLLTLTGQRHGEVELMAWSEIDLDTGIWTIPAARAKNRLAHQVDLCPRARAILCTLPRYARHDPVFVTPGKETVALTEAKKQIDTAMAEILGREVDHWTYHDLRRTFATGLARLEAPPHVIERCINHTSGAQSGKGGIVGIYQHFDYRNDRRAAHMLWAEHIERLIGGNMGYRSAG